MSMYMFDWTGTRNVLLHGTEMDCPMRLRAGVLTGVMTPVRLFDLTTGLTRLLLGSYKGKSRIPIRLV